MELKPGYKQTEIGVIPEDWEVEYLPKICQFKAGKAHEQYITLMGDYICVNSKFISSDGKIQKRCYRNDCQARKGDILMVMSDLPNGKALAKAFVVKEDGLYAVNQRVCALRPYHSNSEYLFYVLNRSPYFLKHDDGVNQTHLLNPVFLKCQLPLPSLREQRAIADSLCGIDSLITSLEKLIEKKKLIKQGVMQELLTGKRRLPGFSGEWETKRLGDLFSLQYGKPMKESDRVESGVIPVYGSNGVVGYTFTELTSCPTIIVGRKGAAGSVHHSPTGCWPIDTTFYIEFDDYTESLFYYYLLQCAGLDRIKSDSAVPGLNRADAYALMITVPSKEERIQIAEILLSIDQEITYLTNSLDKHKLLKQAMMQELLTGRIRLI